MGDLSGQADFDARLTAVARRLADKAALVGDGRSIDYATLESTTRAIAARIESAAAGRQGFVALLFSRRTVGIQAMNAAMRCGRAYVPLDGDDPDERLRFVLRDCEPLALLVDRPLLERGRALADGRCAVVEIAGDEAPDPSFAMPSTGHDPLAGVFYTSGSTGTPKGVMQGREATMFYVDAYRRRLGIEEGDRLSMLFALNFAACIVDVHGAALGGATLCTYDMRRDGLPRLARWLDDERITVVHTIPTVLRELIARLAPGQRLARVRVVDVGGEAAFASDAARFFEHTSDGAILVNHLASTEVGVIAQHVMSRRDPAPEGAILPVGVPPEGVEIRIRRDDGSEAAPGEVGAIVVSSPHVSPGYWRRPDLDAQYLPPDPRRPGARCNVSGDRGYIDAKGLLHYLGRSGSRVKIHGHSVDLTEVEAALAATAGVTRCAAFAPAPGQGREADRIVAFVTTGGPLDAGELRRRLGDRLPSYMLPSAFVFLDAFPTTTTGKVDRAALEKRIPADLLAPRTPTEPASDELELAVAGVFGRLLRVSDVGRHDDFFLLGGDSLLASELQVRLRDAFGFDVPELHRHSTVEAVAAAIRAHRASVSAPLREPSLLVPLRTKGSRPPLFLVHGRMGQALVSPHFLALLGDDQPVYAFRARGLDGGEPHETIEAMASDYTAAVRRTQPHGPYLIGGLCGGAYVAMEIARRLRESGATVLPLLLIDPERPAVRVLESSMTEVALLGRIRLLKETNVGEAPVDDPAYAKSSVRVARALEDAMARHRPLPYDGPVCMLLAREGIAINKPLEKWRKFFSGELLQFVVGNTHDEVLNAKTPQFAEALANTMRRIYRDLANVD